MGALDLNTMTALDYTKASTNHDVSALSATYKNVVDSTAYAIFGDRKGNLFGRYNSHSTAGYYTLTHDMVSNYVFAFKYGGYIMGVYPHDCLTTNTSCVYDNSNPAGGLVFSQYNTGDPKINAQIGKAVGTIGPVSALKAGGFIGVTRGSAAQVLYFEVTDNDLSKGIDVTSLDASITGDPYMYTDFTGATLYDTGSTISTFAFKDQSSFDATKPVHYVAFNWTAVAGSSTSWSRMTLEARCYAGTDGSATDFTTVDIVKDAGLNTFLGVVPSCREKLVDHMDLRIIKLDTTPSAPSIGNISVGFYQ